MSPRRNSGARTLHEVRPDRPCAASGDVERLGLLSALAELSPRFTDQNGILARSSFVDARPTLTDAFELAVYRVVHDFEGVAAAAESGRCVVPQSSDNGRGIPEGADVNDDGSLRGRRARALLAGRAHSVKTVRTDGTDVRLDVPAETG